MEEIKAFDQVIINVSCLKILQEEVEGYVESVEDLGKAATSLIQNDHFDSANINATKVSQLAH